MLLTVILISLIALCNTAPAPGPVAAPEPKPNPSLLLSASPAVVASPVVTYSHYYKSPLYQTYTPYVYNLGYASGYSYNTYPYYVPVHLV